MTTNTRLSKLPEQKETPTLSKDKSCLDVDNNVQLPLSVLTSQESFNETSEVTLAQFHDLWMDIIKIFNSFTMLYLG